MNIYFKWCDKRSNCNYCQEPVFVDTIVAIHSWKTKKRWVRAHFYHPECLSKQFVYKVEMEIPKPVRLNRGRPRLGLTDEQKVARASALRSLKRKGSRENNSGSTVSQGR